MPPKRTRTSRLKVAAIARAVHHGACNSSQQLDGVDAQQTIPDQAQPSTSEHAHPPISEGANPPISEGATPPLSEDANPPSSGDANPHISQTTQSVGTSSTQRSREGRDTDKDWVVDIIDK